MAKKWRNINTFSDGSTVVQKARKLLPFLYVGSAYTLYPHLKAGDYVNTEIGKGRTYIYFRFRTGHRTAVELLIKYKHFKEELLFR